MYLLLRTWGKTREMKEASHTTACRLAAGSSLGYGAINNPLYGASESCMRGKVHRALIRAINTDRLGSVSAAGDLGNRR